MNLFELSGKTALVSGASRGLGKGMAKALASHNATVILVARSEDGLRTTLNEIESEGALRFVISGVGRCKLPDRSDSRYQWRPACGLKIWSWLF